VLLTLVHNINAQCGKHPEKMKFMPKKALHSRPENFKKSRRKTCEIKKNHFMNKFFDQIPFFCNFKNGQKSIFELGKLPKM